MLIAIYIVMVIVTWVHAGYKAGIDVARIKEQHPEANISLDGRNIFFQGVVWPSYWAAEVGKSLPRK